MTAEQFILKLEAEIREIERRSPDAIWRNADDRKKIAKLQETIRKLRPWSNSA